MRILITLLFSANVWAVPTPVKIALNWKPEPQFGGFYATHTLGFDAAEDLLLTVQEGGSGTPTVQMLANHQVDFAVVSAEEILISNARNPKNPVVAVYAVFDTNPQMIMCHHEKGFKSLRDVLAAPVTLAWQSGLTYAQYLKSKYPSIKARIVPYLGGVTTFLADKNFCQQGFVTSEPIAAIKAGAKVDTFLIASEGFNPYTTVLAVRAETWRNQRDLVNRVVRAVGAGWRKYVQNPEAINAEMHDLNPAMDADTFAKSAAAQKPLLSADGAMTKQRWTDLARTLERLHVVEHADAELAMPAKIF